MINARIDGKHSHRANLAQAISLRRVIYLLCPAATVSPTCKQGQVRDAMITHLPLFCCHLKELRHTGRTPFRRQRSQKV